MSSFIPTTRPVIGEDLDSVREQLGHPTADAGWLYGISITKWMMIAKKNPRVTVNNPTLALLVRHLSEDPSLSPIPVAPSAADIFETIEIVRPNIDKKHMAIMFGRESSSGYRWLTKNSNLSPVLQRLFLVFDCLVNQENAKHDGDVEDVLIEWDKMVENEGVQRGIPSIYSTGIWTAGDITESARPVIGEDLDILRDQLGLSTADACWLYGISMTRWMIVVKENPKEMIKNITLALLVKSLMAHPEACPVPNPVQAQDVYDSMREVQPSIDKRRFAIMFGCEASSGYRWITVGSKVSPVLARLFKIFMKKFTTAANKSLDDALNVILEWDAIVQVEASARNKPNIFKDGRWTFKKTKEEKEAKKLLNISMKEPTEEVIS
jgi:hypothetical protein